MRKYLFVLVFPLLLIAGCKKDVQANLVTALPVESESFSTGTIVGRQHVVTLPTGDYTYPTSQGLLWLPKNRNRRKKYPLIINLYGVGQMGSDINLMLISNTMSEYIADGFNPTAVNPVDQKTYQYIVFSPQGPAGSWGWSAVQVKTMLAALEDSLPIIDVSRIYITGFSAGGWGLWSCITDDDSLCSKFAAIVPISTAGADHPDGITNVDKYGIACWQICGDQDSFYGNAVNYTNIINSNNPPIPAILTTLHGVGHSAWVQAYDKSWTASESNGLNIYEWLLQYHK